MTLPEVAKHAGVSRQLVESWCEAEGVDWQRIRAARSLKTWNSYQESAREMRTKRGKRPMSAEALAAKKRADENPQW